ncbi:hypothetical protein QR680_012203 [Steinernema hermaphroditum]|uniref:Uncharacterized protein n=1 Tax=Steinernema hermaphroditum TaxID=289476 RepID=A0AA39M0D7_9BILA|nr:hypothetical protein QR680_012203 [Steinernema hermaphroditum]
MRFALVVLCGVAVSTNAFLFSRPKVECLDEEPKANYIRLKKSIPDMCEPNEIRVSCLSQIAEDSTECIVNRCDNCFKTAYVVDRFSDYCQWMTTCLCTATRLRACEATILSIC